VQGAGPSWAKIIAGNPQQAENLKAITMELPDGATRWQALQNALKIARAQSWRLGEGSPTAPLQEIQRDMESANNIADTVGLAASPGKWWSAAGRGIGKWAYQANGKQLAELITTGNISDLRALAGAVPGTNRASRALATALAGTAQQTARLAPGIASTIPSASQPRSTNTQ
jgi:hypothetical protein